MAQKKKKREKRSLQDFRIFFLSTVARCLVTPLVCSSRPTNNGYYYFIYPTPPRGEETPLVYSYRTVKSLHLPFLEAPTYATSSKPLAFACRPSHHYCHSFFHLKKNRHTLPNLEPYYYSSLQKIIISTGGNIS